MKKDWHVYLDHILESIEHLQIYAKSLTKEEFLQSTKEQDAIIRRIEIIGEAAQNIPKEVRIHHSGIPWRSIIAMRNIIVHNYMGIDLDYVWEVIVRDIEQLKENIIKFKEQL